MTTLERAAMRQALEYIESTASFIPTMYDDIGLTVSAALRTALSQPEQDNPVAWLITDENINSLQVDSIQRLIDRAKHAHMADIKLRINGQDEWYEADWLKHMVKVRTKGANNDNT